MAESNIIEVGQSGNAPYVAFGDESAFGSHLVYAYAVVPRTAVNRLESKLQTLRTDYRFPAGVQIHCSALFSGDRRERLGLGHLRRSDVFGLIDKIVYQLNRWRVHVKFAYHAMAHEEPVANDPGIAIPIDGESGRHDERIFPTKKGLLGLLAQLAIQNPSRRDGCPTVSQCEVIVSRESTKVRFLGDRRRQAHAWASGYSDVGAPDGSVFHIEPRVAEADDVELLQLADVVAYIASHAMSGRAEQGFHARQFDRIQRKHRAILPPDFLRPDGTRPAG